MKIRKSLAFACVLPAASLIAGCGNGGVPTTNSAPTTTMQSLAAPPLALFSGASSACSALPPPSALHRVVSRFAAAICREPATRSSSIGVTAQSTSATSSETVLYRFLGPQDGTLPGDGFVADGAGALYGTTVDGGTHNKGTVYKLVARSSGYAETVLYSFSGGSDGAYPTGSLIVDRAGTLYGTTSGGGNRTCAVVSGSGCGTVFALSPAGSRYVKRDLYAFNGYPTDGSQPGTLIADASGNLYGTTTFGGNSRKCTSEGPGCGIVFKLSPSANGYTESVLHGFHGDGDGLFPTDGLLIDRAGNIYGTTSFGGSTDNGTVFRLTPIKRGYAESVIYSFKHLPDGFGPNGSLIADASGTLYGTTENGGAGGPRCQGGCGTVFALRPTGSAYAETVLYSFKARFDPAFPTGGLVAGRGGTFFGGTGDGGSLHCDLGGCGAIYELAPSGSGYTDRVLYAFKGGNDGQDGQIPLGTLLRGTDGRLYGATGWGGTHNNGTAFSVAP